MRRVWRGSLALCLPLQKVRSPHSVEFKGFVALKFENYVTKFAAHKALELIA